MLYSCDGYTCAKIAVKGKYGEPQAGFCLLNRLACLLVTFEPARLRRSSNRHRPLLLATLTQQRGNRQPSAGRNEHRASLFSPLDYDP